MAPCLAPVEGLHLSIMFLPTALAVVWVNIWTFSSPPPHNQLFVSLRWGVWVFCCDVILFYIDLKHQLLIFLSRTLLRPFFKTRSHNRSGNTFRPSHRFWKCSKNGFKNYCTVDHGFCTYNVLLFMLTSNIFFLVFSGRI